MTLSALIYPRSLSGSRENKKMPAGSWMNRYLPSGLNRGQTRYSSYPLWVIDFTAERSTQFSPRQEFRSAKISDLAYRHTVSLYTSAAVRFLVSKEQLALR